jgi:hypothetical protein
VYTCARLLLDHENFGKLREKEAAFCADALRDKTADVLGMGRDMVRAFRGAAQAAFNAHCLVVA